MAHLKDFHYSIIAPCCKKQPLNGKWCDHFGTINYNDWPTSVSGATYSQQITEGRERKLTKTVESRAARARISAHETTPGQTFSTASFMSATTSKPRTEPLFGIAVFSPVKVELSSSRIEPSQPYLLTPIHAWIEWIVYMAHRFLYLYNYWNESTEK